MIHLEIIIFKFTTIIIFICQELLAYIVAYLIINIIYTSKANFEVVKRREKLRFLTRESVHMKTLLTKVRPRPRLASGLAKPKPEP